MTEFWSPPHIVELEKEKLRQGENIIYIFFGSQDFLDSAKSAALDSFCVGRSNFYTIDNPTFNTTSKDLKATLYSNSGLRAFAAENVEGKIKSAKLLDFLLQIADKTNNIVNVIVLLLFNTERAENRTQFHSNDWKSALENHFNKPDFQMNGRALIGRINRSIQQRNSNHFLVADTSIPCDPPKSNTFNKFFGLFDGRIYTQFAGAPVWWSLITFMVSVVLWISKKRNAPEQCPQQIHTDPFSVSEANVLTSVNVRNDCDRTEELEQERKESSSASQGNNSTHSSANSKKLNHGNSGSSGVRTRSQAAKFANDGHGASTTTSGPSIVGHAITNNTTTPDASTLSDAPLAPQKQKPKPKGRRGFRNKYNNNRRS